MMKKAQDSKEKTKNPEKVKDEKPESEPVEEAPVVEKSDTKNASTDKTTPTLTAKKKSKKPLIITIVIVLLLASICAWFLLTGAFDLQAGTFDFNKLFGTKQETTSENTSEEKPNEPEPEKIYSRLTGLEIADGKINNLPVYCIQIPNDTYGARPQVGLSHAAILFEAIAEGGITRFATVYQNLEDSVIGPIRSLRTYYLDWETPFDCTLVHAGGEEEAKKTAANGTYRDLTESNVYMYRDSRGYAAPDNLFTSTALLTKFNSDKGYASSTPKVFARQTPEESETIAKTVRENTSKESTSKTAETTSGTNQTTTENGELVPVTSFKINFNKNAKNSNFNTVYEYNEKTNSYDRSFQSGAEHLVYNCRAGLEKPSPKQECGEPVQLSPNVVVAMMVDEYTKGNSRESIQTIGSGDAIIFQNGSVIKARWSKGSKSEQITFLDKDGEIIKLAPGQLLIAAVPNAYGSVEY